MCAMQAFPQNWLHSSISEETYYKDSLFKTLYDILALHYCQTQVQLKPHVQGQDHFTPLLAREPFNEERLATVQIERGSGKREITWMQAVIKGLIFCKHTFATVTKLYNTLAQRTESKALYLQWNHYHFLTLSSFNYGKCMSVESNLQSFSVFNISPPPTKNFPHPLKKLFARDTGQPCDREPRSKLIFFISIGLISDYCLAKALQTKLKSIQNCYMNFALALLLSTCTTEQY